MPRTPLLAALLLPLALGACASPPRMQTVESVDLARFMGDWYVIACIPLPIERDAFGAVETYELLPDGRIRTTYTARRGGFDGPEQTFRYTARVANETSNAEWRARLYPPFEHEYLIIALDDDYQRTVVARSRRDHAWIMARTPTISPEHYDPLVDLLHDRGYDPRKLRPVPQRE